MKTELIVVCILDGEVHNVRKEKLTIHQRADGERLYCGTRVRRGNDGTPYVLSQVRSLRKV